MTVSSYQRPERFKPRVVLMPNGKTYGVRVPNGGRGLPAVTIPLHGVETAEEAQKIFRSHGFDDLLTAARHKDIVRIFWSRVVTARQHRLFDVIADYIAELTVLGRANNTLSGYESLLNKWCDFHRVGTQTLAVIKPEHIASFINRPSKHALSVRRHDLMVLTCFFEYCVTKGMIPANPCAGMEVSTKNLTNEQMTVIKRTPFTDEEMDRIEAQTDPKSEWRGFLLFARAFGMRRGDICRLTWSAVKDGRLQIITQKTKTPIDQPLPPQIVAWLATWPRLRPTYDIMRNSPLKSLRMAARRLEDAAEEEYLFPRMAGLDLTDQGSMVSGEFKKLAKKAGVYARGRTLHNYRTTVTTREINGMLESLGGAEKAALSALLVKHGMRGVQKLIGHAADSLVTAGTYFNPKTT